MSRNRGRWRAAAQGTRSACVSGMRVRVRVHAHARVRVRVRVRVCARVRVWPREKSGGRWRATARSSFRLWAQRESMRDRETEGAQGRRTREKGEQGLMVNVLQNPAFVCVHALVQKPAVEGSANERSDCHDEPRLRIQRRRTRVDGTGRAGRESGKGRDQ
jgi:hypothetical protein